MSWHSMAPTLSALFDKGLVEAVSVHQKAVFEAALLFTNTEGILPAPESSHAIRVAVDEALKAKKTGEKKVILFNLSGHGNFDLSAYHAYQSGNLEDYDYPEEEVAKIKSHLPEINLA